MSLTVSVMQPYFFPYAGYYRLLAEADVFVIYDCVQFPRRGYVHRNQLALADGALGWLTLPLEKSGQTTVIQDLRFRGDALARFKSRAGKFPSLKPVLDGRAPEGISKELVNALFDFNQSPVDYLQRTISLTAESIGLAPRIIRSSDLGIAPGVRGQDRVMKIVQALDGIRYINAPGGLPLYDGKSFASKGVELSFLPDFNGPFNSALDILLTSGPATLRRLVSRV